MPIRTIDIARRLGLSATTIRKYEDYGLTPPVPRSAAGYRLYTEAHVAYIACAYAMQPGFTQPQIAAMFMAIQQGRQSEAFWQVTKLQSELYQDRLIADRIEHHLQRHTQPDTDDGSRMTIRSLSRKTEIPVTTLRYWDSIGLLPALRDPGNGYRLYTPAHVTHALTIYALKLSTYASHGKYYVASAKEELARLDLSNRVQIHRMLADMRGYLDDINQARIKAIAALHALCENLKAKGP